MWRSYAMLKLWDRGIAPVNGAVSSCVAEVVTAPNPDVARTGSSRYPRRHRIEAVMYHYAGIDVSVESPSLCVVG